MRKPTAKSGTEQDYIGHYMGRGVAGHGKGVKRAMNKRFRRDGKATTRGHNDEC